MSEIDETEPPTFAEIYADRQKGKELAWLEQSVNGSPPRYLLMGYEVYPNGTTSNAIEDSEIADHIGHVFGLGATRDPAGFAIWTEDRAIPWQRLRNWATAMRASAHPGIRDLYRGLLEVMDQLEQKPGSPLFGNDESWADDTL